MRSNIYDNIKGIGILLVILGHVWIAPSFLVKLIYAFHMPMFFMLSGYLFNTEKKKQLEFSEFIIPRIKRLYLPALFIGFTCSIPSMLSGRTDSVMDFSSRAFGVIYSIPKAELTFDCTPIWFLTCLLCVELYFYLIVRYVKSQIWLAVLCLFSIGIILSRELSFYSPLNSHIALTGLFFFYLGNRLRDHQFIENHTPRISYLCLAVFALVATTYLNPTQIGLATNRLGDINYLMIGTISGCYIVLYLSNLSKNSQLISYLGQNTILILGYNYWAYILIDRVFRHFELPYNWLINFLVQTLLFLVAGLVLRKIPILDLLIQGKQRNKKPI